MWGKKMERCEPFNKFYLEYLRIKKVKDQCLKECSDKQLPCQEWWTLNKKFEDPSVDCYKYQEICPKGCHILDLVC